MTLHDLFGPENLFHPEVFYEGEWILGGIQSLIDPKLDYLVLNSKMSRGKNAYETFLEKNYFKPMTDLLNSASVIRPFFPKIALGVDEKGEKRNVCFSIAYFLHQQMTGFLDSEEAFAGYIKLTQEGATLADCISYIKEAARADRKKYTDVQNKGNKSAFFAAIYQLYLNYVRYSSQAIGFPEFLENKIRGTTKMIIGARYYPKFFSKEIDTEALLKCFDYDTFCLVAAKSALDACQETEKDSGQVNNCITYITLYLDAVAELRKSKPKYQADMIVVDEETSTTQHITIDDIKREYEAILARHPEFRLFRTTEEGMEDILRKSGLSEEDITEFDSQTRTHMEIITQYLAELQNDRELAANWTFIPKGSKLDTNPFPEKLKNPSAPLPEEEKIRRMLVCRDYLENNDKVIYKVLGMEAFSGYVAYVFQNGMVVLNRYYQNIKTKKVASECATYIMHYTYFLEFSKMSKPDIIRYMQEHPTAQIDRAFHRQDMDLWISQVERYVSSDDYNQDAIDFFHWLIDSGELKKAGVKS